MRRADQEGAEVAGIVAVGHRHRRAGAQLAQEGPHPHQRARHVRGREGQDRVLSAAVGQGGIVVRVMRDGLGGGLGQGQAHGAGVVEGHGIAVHDLERLHRIAACVAFHRVLADALDMGLGPDGVADRAAGGDVGVAQAEPGRRAVVAGRGGDRGDGDVADADGDAVADLGALHQDGGGDLVSAAQGRGDHRAPAARRGIGDDGAAVFDRPQHRCSGVKDAVGEFRHDDAAARCGNASVWHDVLRLSAGAGSTVDRAAGTARSPCAAGRVTWAGRHRRSRGRSRSGRRRSGPGNRARRGTPRPGRWRWPKACRAG
jgi:hypothetical protein